MTIPTEDPSIPYVIPQPTYKSRVRKRRWKGISSGELTSIRIEIYVFLTIVAVVFPATAPFILEVVRPTSETLFQIATVANYILIEFGLVS
jgi:hypothetical protein